MLMDREYEFILRRASTRDASVAIVLAALANGAPMIVLMATSHPVFPFGFGLLMAIVAAGFAYFANRFYADSRLLNDKRLWDVGRAFTTAGVMCVLGAIALFSVGVIMLS
jgi:H+/Cl- antiporter ClcA